MSEPGTPDRQAPPELEGFTPGLLRLLQAARAALPALHDCGAWRHVPREMCAECGSWSWEWARSSGRGRVFTWTVVARALHPAFQDDCPYAPVVVEMEEGVRLCSARSWTARPDELEIDMPVEVVFEDVTDEVTLPKFRRIAA